MSFYFSLYQIIEGVERLIHDFNHLASRALRISPRDARTNRELLEQCETKMVEVRNILTHKSHISKVTLRKASLLFEILEVNYRRVLHLAAATAFVGEDDGRAVKGVWQLLATAQRHYRTLLENLDGLTGIPASVALKAEPAAVLQEDSFAAVLHRETEYQLEALKILDKAVEVFGEEEWLSDKLAAMRKELIDNKRVLKQLAAEPAPREAAVPAHAV
jgi:hypothetical protein